MNGNEPTFRWDTHGITAFDFDYGANDSIVNINSRRGVRFNKFGLFGFDNVDGFTWKPKSISDINDNSLFYLTWDGLKLRPSGSIYKGSYSNDEGSQ
jgi:hypothetical protein